MCIIMGMKKLFPSIDIIVVLYNLSGGWWVQHYATRDVNRDRLAGASLEVTNQRLPTLT